MRAPLGAMLLLPLAGAQPDSADLRRAWQRRPRADSAVAGATGKAAFDAISRAMRAGAAATRPCEEFDHGELNALHRRLHGERDPRLGHAYGARGDKRALHYDGMGYKEGLWAQEARQPRHSAAYNRTRDGKCAEAAMLHAHHVGAPARRRLAAAGLTLPLMPAAGPDADHADREYIFQITCATCHVRAEGSEVADPPLPPRLGNKTKCPIDPQTGEPTVFYNRTKRCDWDFDPPCAPCEGIGGYIWGNGAEEIRYTTCEALMKPEDVPKDNLTSPIWPEQVTIQAYNNQIDQKDQGGPFPGSDPCDLSHGFELQYEQTYWYDGTQPVASFTQKSNYVAPAFGSNGGANVTENGWHFPSTNMFVETINPNNNLTLMCQCIGIYQNGDHSTKPLGPLRNDFAKDAVLVGRERIGLEAGPDSSPPTSGIWKEIVADHWMLGPHHFWMEVETNLMLRGWQPFNALQVFYGWELGKPDPARFEISKTCLDHYTANLTCAPQPGVTPPQ